MTQAKPDKPKLNPFLKLALDMGPLVVFFAANARFGIFAATAIFMAAIVAALAVSYTMTRHVAIMPVVSAVVVLLFGFTPLTFVFAMLQYPLLLKYATEQPNPEAEAEREASP